MIYTRRNTNSFDERQEAALEIIPRETGIPEEWKDFLNTENERVKSLLDKLALEKRRLIELALDNQVIFFDKVDKIKGEIEKEIMGK